MSGGGTVTPIMGRATEYTPDEDAVILSLPPREAQARLVELGYEERTIGAIGARKKLILTQGGVTNVDDFAIPSAIKRRVLKARMGHLQERREMLAMQAAELDGEIREVNLRLDRIDSGSALNIEPRPRQ